MDADDLDPRRARTWVEIDLGAIVDNLRALSARLPGVEVLVPVKADAYGHGLVPVARAVRAAGAWGLGVATLDEAAALRDGGVSGPLVVLMPVLPGEAPRAVALDATPSIGTWPQAEALAGAATAAGRRLAVHVEVDTGMGRTGVSRRNAVELVERIARLPGLNLDGMFTHLATADEPDRGHAERQLDRFEEVLRALAERRIRPPRVHAANSAAALRFRRAHRALVRPGIALYGAPDEIDPGTDTGARPSSWGELFAPALSWHARVVAVRSLEPGDAVSYHRLYRAAGRERIAILGVGYGDGWPHALSNRGRVLLRGRPAPIRGAICMDLTMVDATSIPDLDVGEMATLIGGQGVDRQGAAEVARQAGTISYAILTGIAARVHRLYHGA